MFTFDTSRCFRLGLTWLLWIPISRVHGICPLCRRPGDSPPNPDAVVNEFYAENVPVENDENDPFFSFMTCGEVAQSPQFLALEGRDCIEGQVYIGIAACGCPVVGRMCSVCPDEDDSPILEFQNCEMLQLGLFSNQYAANEGWLSMDSQSFTFADDEDSCAFLRSFSGYNPISDCGCAAVDDPCSFCADGSNYNEDLVKAKDIETCRTADVNQAAISAEWRGTCGFAQTANSLDCGCEYMPNIPPVGCDLCARPENDLDFDESIDKCGKSDEFLFGGYRPDSPVCIAFQDRFENCCVPVATSPPTGSPTTPPPPPTKAPTKAPTKNPTANPTDNPTDNPAILLPPRLTLSPTIMEIGEGPTSAAVASYPVSSYDSFYWIVGQTMTVVALMLSL